MRVYTVRDIVAEKCGPLFLESTDESAHRGFRRLVRDSDFPEDYDLLFLGTIDENTGALDAVAPRVITPSALLELEASDG